MKDREKTNWKKKKPPGKETMQEEENKMKQQKPVVLSLGKIYHNPVLKKTQKTNIPGN